MLLGPPSDLCVTFSFPEEGSIDITDPCRYPVAVGIEKEYIPDQNMWVTSMTNDQRAAHYARLNGWDGKPKNK